MKLPLLLPTKVVDVVGEERAVVDKAFIIPGRAQGKKNLCDLLRIPLLVLIK